MTEVKFYLAGGMGGLSIEEQTAWRNDIEKMITPYGEDVGVSTYFFSPPYYYQPDGDYHKSEKEARDFDLNRLRHSDVVIVNFNVPNSIGTAQELAVAYEHRIPVIGLNEDANELHPWLYECCTRICETKQELLEHIVNFYLT
jgi:nucleoside 2-deoxyribosyltransferase